MARDVLVSGHSVNQAVGNLIATLEKTELFERTADIDSGHLATLTRASIFTRQTKSLLTDLSASELSISLLDGINSGLTHCNNEIVAFIADGNVGHIGNASSYLDAAIASASQAFFKRPSKHNRAYSESIAVVQNAAQKALAKISSQSQTLEKNILQSEGRIAEQVRANEESRSRLNAAVIEAQNSTNAATVKLENIESKLSAKSEQSINELGVKFTEEVAERKQSADIILNDIKNIESQARTILQIVGNVGVTGNYQKRSNEECGQANLSRWITVAIFAIGILFVAINLLKNISGTIDLQTLIIRFAIAVSITIPAFYTARESARHRSNADRAKQTELELASLSPFLQNLPEVEREKLISQLTPQYFGKSIDAHEIQNPVDLNKALDNIAKMVAR